jgi:hypothetical protein
MCCLVRASSEALTPNLLCDRSQPLVPARHGLRYGERQPLPGEDLVLGAGQPELHFVWAGRQPNHNDRIGPTPRVRPAPRQAVNRDMQMPDPWRDLAGSLPEHRQYAEVLRPVRDEDGAPDQRPRKRGIHRQLGCRLVLDGKNTGGLPAFPALWARAPVTSTAAAAALTSVLMNMAIAVSRLGPIGVYVDLLDGPRRACSLALSERTE